MDGPPDGRGGRRPRRSSPRSRSRPPLRRRVSRARALQPRAIPAVSATPHRAPNRVHTPRARRTSRGMAQRFRRPPRCPATAITPATPDHTRRSRASPRAPVPCRPRRAPTSALMSSPTPPVSASSASSGSFVSGPALPPRPADCPPRPRRSAPPRAWGDDRRHCGRHRLRRPESSAPPLPGQSRVDATPVPAPRKGQVRPRTCGSTSQSQPRSTVTSW